MCEMLNEYWLLHHWQSLIIVLRRKWFHFKFFFHWQKYKLWLYIDLFGIVLGDELFVSTSLYLKQQKSIQTNLKVSKNNYFRLQIWPAIEWPNTEKYTIEQTTQTFVNIWSNRLVINCFCMILFILLVLVQ